MYQTVGHHAIEAYAEAMGVPLYRHTIDGTSKQQTLYYASSEEIKDKQDEVEDLFELLRKVKVKIVVVQ
jgi:diphthine-ammonia ligase